MVDATSVITVLSVEVDVSVVEMTVTVENVSVSCGTVFVTVNVVSKTVVRVVGEGVIVVVGIVNVFWVRVKSNDLVVEDLGTGFTDLVPYLVRQKLFDHVDWPETGRRK